MFYELSNFIDKLTDENSRKIWTHFVNQKTCINDNYYTRASIFNSDFMPKDNLEHKRVEKQPAQNDWRKSCWKMELERIYSEEPYLLTDKELIEIGYWKKFKNDELPTSFDKNSYWSPSKMIKRVDYYKEDI